MTKLQTPVGEIDLIEPDVAIFKQLQDYLTFGFVELRNQDNPSAKNYGIVMKCGEQEVLCLKQQPLEIERQSAEQIFKLHHMMVVDAYCRYIKLGFSGAYLASPYLRQRDNGLWEAGVAHFIFPSNNENKTTDKTNVRPYDDEFGKGATDMFLGFVDCFKQAFSDAKLTMPQYLGIAVRSRSHIQNMAMNFMVLGSEIICVRTNLREKEDVAWAILAKGGINRVYHLPSHPLTINESDLKISKGNRN